MPKKTLKERILENYIESEYVDVFLTFLDGKTFSLYVTFTGFDQEVITYEDFLALVQDQIEYIRNTYDVRDSSPGFNFGLYYYDMGELDEVTDENYPRRITQSNILLFATCDTKKALELYRSK